MRRIILSALALTALAACTKPADSNTVDADGDVTMVDAGETVFDPDNEGTTADAATTTLIPPAPGEPGGLPDDRTPLSEGKITPESPQGAAQVVQQFAIALEQGKFDVARAAWSDGGRASGLTAAQFAEAYAKYAEIHAQTGAPSAAEGAAGSLYVTVPLQLYGRLKAGGTFNLIGPVTLRRVNNVDGATPEQLKWHISQSDLKPRGTVKEGPAG